MWFHRLPLSLALMTLCLSGLTACMPRIAGVPVVPLLAPDAQLQSGVSTDMTRRPDGTVLVNGQPFFPFGFYHVSWARGGTPLQREKDLQRMAGAGFNVMVTEPTNDNDVAHFGTVLQDAQTAGIFIIPYGLGDDTLKHYKSAPALLGIKVADDANAQWAPQQVWKRSQTINRLAPAKLTYISLSVTRDRNESQFFGAADMIGNQSYPVGNDDIGVVYPMMRSTIQSALSKGSVPIANLQSAPAGRAAPSAAEVRNMTYQALMAGVKGIIYYAYRSKEGDLNRNPALWQSLSAMSKEVALLSPVLLDGQRQELSDGAQGRPLVVTIKGSTATYLLALNNSRKQSQQVQVQLPATPQLWQPVATRNGALSSDGKTVNGKLAPLQVAVYRTQ